MKATLTRDQRVRDVNMSRADRKRAVARYVAGEISRAEISEILSRVAKAGEVIDHPKAYKLVQLGVAEPADNECQLRAQFTDAQITTAQLASEKLESGNSLPEELEDQNADYDPDDEDDDV